MLAVWLWACRLPNPRRPSLRRPPVGTIFILFFIIIAHGLLYPAGSGTTWHAAGLMGRIGGSPRITRMRAYGAHLYAELEQTTGTLYFVGLPAFMFFLLHVHVILFDSGVVSSLRIDAVMNHMKRWWGWGFIDIVVVTAATTTTTAVAVWVVAAAVLESRTYSPTNPTL